jgi:Tol biopolymer transport system component
MTDDQLELRLREWYRAEIPTDEIAPTALRARLTTIPSEVSTPWRRFTAPGLQARARRRLSTMSVLSRLAAAAVIGVLAVATGFYLTRPERPEVSHPSPTPISSPTPSASASPDIAVDASPSPQLSTPSSSPEPCVLTGDALPPVDPVGIEGLGRTRGVYVAGRPPMLWAINPGQDSATLIASIPPEPPIAVLDISPDGSNALITPSTFGGSTSECAGLYLIRTDGLGATRLTTFGRISTGAFSPDGRRIAYSRSDPGIVTTLDLETGATVDQLCGSVYSSFQMYWSPSGEKIAVSCDFSLTILDAAGTTAPVRFMTGGDPLAFTWTDDRQLVVATDAGDIYSFDVVSQSSSLVGRFEDPAIEIVSTTGVFSPDGRWLAYHGGERGDVPGNDFTEVGYLVPTSGGTPTRMPDEVQLTTTWSGDSRALVYISGQPESPDGILVRMDVETLQSSTIGTIADLQSYLHAYRHGVWRVP